MHLLIAARTSLTYLFLILIFTKMVMPTNHKHKDSLYLRTAVALITSQ